MNYYFQKCSYRTKNLINQKQKNWIENLNQGSQTEELTSSPTLSFLPTWS